MVDWWGQPVIDLLLHVRHGAPLTRIRLHVRRSSGTWSVLGPYMYIPAWMDGTCIVHVLAVDAVRLLCICTGTVAFGGLKVQSQIISGHGRPWQTLSDNVRQ